MDQYNWQWYHRHRLPVIQYYLKNHLHLNPDQDNLQFRLHQYQSRFLWHRLYYRHQSLDLNNWVWSLRHYLLMSLPRLGFHLRHRQYLKSLEFHHHQYPLFLLQLHQEYHRHHYLNQNYFEHHRYRCQVYMSLRDDQMKCDPINFLILHQKLLQK